MKDSPFSFIYIYIYVGIFVYSYQQQQSQYISLDDLSKQMLPINNNNGVRSTTCLVFFAFSNIRSRYVAVVVVVVDVDVDVVMFNI